MKGIIVSAPGKLHLIGEHSVVYGYPALIVAVDRRCFVSLKDSKMPQPKQIGSYVNFCTKTALNYFKKESSNFNISIKSQIPLGSGMGSSAAIAVAVSGFISGFFTKKIDRKKINDIAYECEKIVHGNPSGGDNSASVYGGFIWYQKKNGKKIIKRLKLNFSKNFSSRFFIINSGRPKESTKEMVDFVSDEFSKNKKKIGKIFKEQGELTEKLLLAIKKEDVNQTSQIIKKAEDNLEKLNIVSKNTKKIIRDIEKTGGAAKICGAGGIKDRSGIILVFHDNFNQIEKIAKKFSLRCEKINLGEEGIRWEK